MFDIGWSELIIIGIVALIAIGPKELPGVLRMLGQWMGKLRRMASDFQSQFQEAMREAEMADIKKEIDAIGDSARDLNQTFDPTADTSGKNASSEATLPGVEPPAPAASVPAGDGKDRSAGDGGIATAEPPAAETAAAPGTETGPTGGAPAGEEKPQAEGGRAA